MKKGRHRRFEEARALKRSHEVDLDDLFEDISDSPEGQHKPEHDAWADMAEEWDSKQANASTADDDVEAADESDAGDDIDSDDLGDDSATSESEAAS